jgi:methionyl-tRNA synthetase
MNKKPFYITTPIFYPNAELHMGHAFTVTVCDMLARYYRLRGHEVHFLSGSDEHASKIVRVAEKEGKKPAEFIDGIVEAFKKLYGELDISYDQFIRTSDKAIHWPGAQKMWNELVARGDIYKKSYKGMYCVGHEAFITEKELVDGKCPDHGTVPELLEEENYFFALSKYTAVVRDLIKSGEFSIEPASRRGEILSVLESPEGLQDVSFSRPASKNAWAIPVPNDPTQTMYVWCDALASYITAVGYGRDEALFKKWWPASYHVIGKDILRFHAAFWPAMLIAAGLGGAGSNTKLPQILVHGMITSGGRKMSKTLGNVVRPMDLIQEYGKDALRYFIAREIPTYEDGDMTPELFKAAYNASLANGLGNLANRIIVMALNYGVDLAAQPTLADVLARPDFAWYSAAFEKESGPDIHGAAQGVWDRIAAADLRIQQSEPFKLYKTDPAAAQKIVSELLVELWTIALLLTPFMPSTAAEIQTAIKEKRKPTLFPRK